MIIRKLVKYFPNLSKLKQDNGEIEQYIMVDEIGEPIGYVNFQKGELSQVGVYDEDENVQQTSIDIDEIIAMTYAFVADLATKQLNFHMMLDMDSFYLIVYEAMDPIYNLPLPSSGAHIYVGKEGKIRSAKFFIEEYAIEYPEIAITAEEAKGIVSSETLVQLSIQLDEDHNNIRYIYKPRHEIVGVNINGKIENASEWNGNHLPTYEPIGDVKPIATLESFLGVTDDLKKIRTSRSTEWFMPGKTDYPIAEILETKTDLTYESHYEIDKDHQIDEQAALELAKSFLTLHVGGDIVNYHLEVKPKLTKEEEEQIQQEVAVAIAGESLEEVGNEEVVFEDFLSTYEPTYDFKFVPFYRNIQLDMESVEVSIGLCSGIVRYARIQKHNFAIFSRLEEPVITLEAADKLYKHEMQLMLTRVFHNLTEKHYTLMYLIGFPKTVGAIDLIDAMTGEIEYVDTGFIKVN